MPLKMKTQLFPIFMHDDSVLITHQHEVVIFLNEDVRGVQWCENLPLQGWAQTHMRFPFAQSDLIALSQSRLSRVNM